jgi:RHS repeat-associated protein
VIQKLRLQITTRSETKETIQTPTIDETEEYSQSYAPITEIEESKLYVDPSTHFFWYGFGQGVIQGFSGAPQYLSAWFHDSWDYITNQYYMYDGQGSVSALTSVRGNSVVTYQYDAYGTAKVSGETYSPYQYNAEPVDTNTGLQYLRARYYNSSIGGFITQDTYTGNLRKSIDAESLYVYRK